MLQKTVHTTICASEAYARLSGLPGRLLLDDSARPEGRYSILAVDPRMSLTVRNGRLVLRRRGGGLEVSRDLAGALRTMLAEISDLGPVPEGEQVFVGGLAGFLGYELNRLYEDVPVTNAWDSRVPDALLGGYDCWVELDEARPGRVRVLSLDTSDEAMERVEGIGALLEAGETSLVPYCPPAERRPAVSNIPRARYLGLVRRIQDLIRAGDVYQVNLTQRFLVRVPDDPVSVFEHIRAGHPAPFGALMDFQTGAISSHSPESFVRMDGDLIESKPIKGTIKRATDPDRDGALSRALQSSEKDLAELAMIVDLIRNDLSRVCRPGSVTVHDHAHVESAPTVHHLVTNVRGRLRGDADFADLLAAAWPGGSITGAPKIRAMEVIDELESVRRGPYTGAIGYLGVDGRSEWNIAIRTLVLEGGYARIHGGGGIVIDSDPESEYKESIVKVSGLLDALDADVVT